MKAKIYTKFDYIAPPDHPAGFRVPTSKRMKGHERDRSGCRVEGRFGDGKGGVGERKKRDQKQKNGEWGHPRFLAGLTPLFKVVDVNSETVGDMRCAHYAAAAA